MSMNVRELAREREGERVKSAAKRKTQICFQDESEKSTFHDDRTCAGEMNK